MHELPEWLAPQDPRQPAMVVKTSRADKNRWMPTIRAADQPGDRARITHIDTSFQTNRIYRVTADPAGFRLQEEPAHPPRVKTYPVPHENLGEDLVVAQHHGELIGFGEVIFEPWNRRATIAHPYVSPSSRGLGIGTAILEALDRRARTSGARCLWLETQNINDPAIQFYRRSGFRLCGLDDTLYDPERDPTTSSDEVALFFTRPF
jgi:ribosomal protein S18 acetylase RimI-like enzyme